MTGASDMMEKWGEAVAERGFSQVPNYLLFFNQFRDEGSKLSPLELLLLIELVGNWWNKKEPPFPSMKTLATRCGASERQVLRAVIRLESQGLIKRQKRRRKGVIAPNAYDMTPLSDALASLAEQFPNAFPRAVRRPQSSVKSETSSES